MIGKNEQMSSNKGGEKRNDASRAESSWQSIKKSGNNLHLTLRLPFHVTEGKDMAPSVLIKGKIWRLPFFSFVLQPVPILDISTESTQKD